MLIVTSRFSIISFIYENSVFLDSADIHKEVALSTSMMFHMVAKILLTFAPKFPKKSEIIPTTSQIF